jgi:hypothetical protein
MWRAATICSTVASTVFDRSAFISAARRIGAGRRGSGTASDSTLHPVDSLSRSTQVMRQAGGAIGPARASAAAHLATINSVMNISVECR